MKKTKSKNRREKTEEEKGGKLKKGKLQNEYTFRLCLQRPQNFAQRSSQRSHHPKARTFQRSGKTAFWGWQFGRGGNWRRNQPRHRGGAFPGREVAA